MPSNPPPRPFALSPEERRKLEPFRFAFNVGDRAWRNVLPVLRASLTTWAKRRPTEARRLGLSEAQVREAQAHRAAFVDQALALVGQIMRSLFAPDSVPSVDVANLRRVQRAADGWALPGPTIVDAVYDVLDAATADAQALAVYRWRDLTDAELYMSAFIWAEVYLPGTLDRIPDNAWVQMLKAWRGRRPFAKRGRPRKGEERVS